MTHTETEFRQGLSKLADEAPAFVGWVPPTTVADLFPSSEPATESESVPRRARNVARVATRRAGGIAFAVAASLALVLAVAIGSGSRLGGPTPGPMADSSSGAVTPLENREWVLAARELGGIQPQTLQPGPRPSFSIRDGQLSILGVVNSTFFEEVQLEAGRILPRAPAGVGAAGCVAEAAKECGQDNRISDFFGAGPKYVLHPGWLELIVGDTRLAFEPQANPEAQPGSTPSTPSTPTVKTN